LPFVSFLQLRAFVDPYRRKGGTQPFFLRRKSHWGGQ
jgi:hypothetical protein